MTLAVLLVGAAIGFGVAWFVASDDDEEPVVQTEPMQEQEQQQPERVVSLDSNYLGNYSLASGEYDSEVTVTVDAGADTRTIVANALPNHETGEFPNTGNPNTISAQSATYEFPLSPVFVGTPTGARTPGVALNGVKFEPGTAEVATCDGTTSHRIEALQDVTDLGLDFNNAHVQPTGEYHYHGVSTMLAEAFDSESDLVHVGFAADGHLMYYSKSGAYTPSYALGSGDREGTNCGYTSPGPNGAEVINFDGAKDGALTSDWGYVAGSGDLDECNGITINGQYVYVLTNEYPYISRCLMGEFTESAPGGGGGAAPGGGAPQGGAPQGQPPR